MREMANASEFSILALKIHLQTKYCPAVQTHSSWKKKLLLTVVGLVVVGGMKGKLKHNLYPVWPSPQTVVLEGFPEDTIF